MRSASSTPADSLSPEILARGEPNLLDLGIALCAAVAASFALARPGIAGAVAGVAIATALVPPVCAAGVSFAEGLTGYGKASLAGDVEIAVDALWNGVGATALFATNLIAIIFASFLTFRAMGVTNKLAPPRDRRAARLGVAVLILGILVLSFPLRAALSHQVSAGRMQALGSPLARRTIQALVAEMDRDYEGHDVELILAARSNVTGRVFLWIASDQELPQSYAERLRVLVRKHVKDPEAEVTVFAVRLVWKDGEITEDR